MRFPELAHGSFNAMEGYLPAALGAETVFSWSQTGQVARDGYRALVEVVTTTARALAGLTDLAFSDLPDELGTTETLTPLEVTTSGDPGG